MKWTNIAKVMWLLTGLSVAALPAQERVYSFSTLAGTPSAGHADGNSETARFSGPSDVAVDAQGNIYVADTNNRAVRKITPAGVVSTVAGAPFEARGIDGPLAGAGFWGPSAIEVDPMGNIFVADGISVRRIGADGQVTTLAGYAGSEPPVSSRVDGVGTNARFNGVTGLGLSPAGTLYTGDLTDKVIRQITPAGVVSTIAGQGSSGHADGQGSAAGFGGPAAFYVDATGTVWIADIGNNLIRRMTPQGLVSTFVGTAGVEGDKDGIGPAAALHTPLGITGDLLGNLYISEFGTQGVRKIDPTAQTTLMAGKIGPDISSRQGSDDGQGRQASFSHPQGLATDRAGNVYVADWRNNLIRKMTPSGLVTTVAGYAPEESAGHRDARGAEARFRNPAGIAVTAEGIAYVADVDNHVIRKIAADGTVSTFAGKPGEPGYANGSLTEARFDRPHSLALGQDGSLYLTDANNAVRKITPAGVVIAIAGSNQATREMINGQGAAASFARPGVLAVAPDGSVYLTDVYTRPYGGVRTALRRIAVTGEVSVEQWEFRPHSGIGGMAFAPDGALYLTDGEYGMIFRLKRGDSSEPMKLKSPDGGFLPHGIAIDAQGNVFLTESAPGPGSRVAQMSADGTVRILGGVKYSGWKDGVGTKALFHRTAGIAVDGQGSLYIACGSNVIRKGVVAGAPVITTQPQSATLATGGSVQLAVVATAEPAPGYQWHRNGVAINGATSANLQASEAGSYTVTVSNAVGSVTSQTATVTLSAGSPSGNSGGGGEAGGGGSPSLLFLGALSALGFARWWNGRQRSGI